MLAFGVVGCSRIGAAHAKAISLMAPRATILGFASHSEKRAQEFAHDWGGTAHSDWRRLLEEPRLDAVVIAGVNSGHFEVALEALQLGKHVLIEKPMALCLEECDALISAAAANNCKFQVGHAVRYSSENAMAREILRSGELGDVVTISDVWFKPFLLHERRPWFLDPAQGGGMWWMHGPHMVDRALWFSGSNVVRVSAGIGALLVGAGVDDTAAAILHHANGRVTTLTHAAYEVGDERWHGEVICTRGMMRVSTFPPGRGLWVARDNKGYVVVVSPANDAILSQMEAFVDCIEKGGKEAVSAQEARHVVEILLACQRSAREGREVVLTAS